VARSHPLFLAVTCLCQVLACSEPPRTTLALADHFDAALLEGQVERLDAGLRIPAGASITYHFPVPSDARLEGEVTSRGGATARIVARGESGGERVLWAGEGVLALDLPEHAGEMLRLGLSAQGPEAGDVLFTRLALSSPADEGAGREPSNLARGPYNVLLILFDSLRADETQPYGAADAATPAVGALADAGVTFVRARASASWTRASVAAMFTALEPPRHGVLAFGQKLGERAPYLPEILRDAGYLTVSVVDNAMVSRAFGFARGFEEFHEIFSEPGAERRGARPREHAKRVWKRFVLPALAQAGDRPFFVYLHEQDPHSPYDPPGRFRPREEFGQRSDVESTIPGLRAMRQRPEEVTEADVRYLRALYRGEVAYMDVYLEGILEALAAAGHAEDTLVILASDHGEEFWEHQSIGHAHAVYEELLRVPLILRLPGVLPAGLRVESDVGLVDLAPTILDLLALPVEDGLQGESLLPSLAAESAHSRRAHFAYAAKPPTESVTFGRWKLVLDAATVPPAPRLFDLERDPGERVDLAAAHSVVVGTLAQMLRTEHARGAALGERQAAPVELPPAVRENLRALGYAE